MYTVSIIIPAYNVENYISRCLESVINQTYTNLDIVVVNDGCTDKTRDIIKFYADKDKRIKLIDIPNSGVNYARKKGVENCFGEYILFLDSDDWLELDCVEKLIDVIEDEENLDIIFFEAYKVNDIEKKIMNLYKINENYDLIMNLFLDNIACCIWGKFIHKSFFYKLEEAFPCDILMGEDLAMVFNIFLRNPKIKYLEIPLYNYYTRIGSLTTKLDEKSLTIVEAFEYIKNKLIEYKLYNKYFTYYEYMIYKHLVFYKFSYMEKEHPLHFDFYMLIKHQNLNMNNPFIKQLKKEYPIQVRIRLCLYRLNYVLGNYFDLVKKYIKCLF